MFTWPQLLEQEGCAALGLTQDIDGSDHFPHHMDAEWCATQDFKQRIAHGTLVLSVGIGMTAKITEKRDHPKRRTHGIVVESVDITNQRGATVLACEHLYLVERKA